jgi:hypothetical protein
MKTPTGVAASVPVSFDRVPSLPSFTKKDVGGGTGIDGDLTSRTGKHLTADQIDRNQPVRGIN